MGTLTRSDMRTEVRYRLDNRTNTDSGGPTDAQLNSYLYWAYRHVSRPNIYRHRELQATQNVTLVTDTAAYTLSTVPFAIHNVFNQTDGYRLTPVDVRRLDGQPVVGGRPSMYAVWVNTLTLSPRPTSSENGDTVVVRYWQAPVDFANDAAVTALRDDWDEIIVAGAVWRGWSALNQRERALEARDEFGTLINEVQQIMRIEGEDWGWQPELTLAGETYLRGDL